MAGTPVMGLGLPTRIFYRQQDLVVLWILRTDSCKSRRIGFHHLEGLEKILPVTPIIAVFTVVWSMGQRLRTKRMGWEPESIGVGKSG
jgi:hypothetical protein